MQVAALLEHLQRDGGGRERKRDADDEGRGSSKPHREGDTRDHGGADGELAHAEAEDVALHRREPRQLELEADDEQQQHHPELGDPRHHLRVLDERQAERPDRHAGGEVAEDAALPEASEQWHGDHGRGAEHQDRS